MSYSEITPESACRSFAPGLDQDTDLFGAVSAVRVSTLLRSILEDYVNRPEYSLDQRDRVLGILVYCVGEDPATAGAAA